MRVVLVAAFGCLGGCIENSAATPSQGPSPAAVSATLALDLRNPSAARESIFGDAVLFPVPGRGLALAVDGGTAGRDGYVDQVFVLQQETASAVEARVLSDADIFYAGRLLLVRAAGHASIAFVLQGNGDAEPDMGSVPAGAERFTGFGISRRTGAWEVALDEVTGARMSDLLPTCASAPSDGLRTAATCDSGGAGSTSCSTTCVPNGSCSTSCGSGYYACCNKAVCTCTCEASGGPQTQPINITSHPQG